jgi:hypothetical protein
VLPVKVTARIRGSAISGSTSLPATKTARRKSSRPKASATIFPMAPAQPGTFEACLSRIVFPAISAGAAKRKACQSGKFHGMMASTGPSG